MGLFRRLFTRRSPKEALIAGCIPAVDETERVYRNQLEGYALSGAGLLKARLFSASFIASAYMYGGYASDENDAMEVINMCSGVAWKSFSDPSFRPTFSQEEATCLAPGFMSNIIKLIKQELETGPSQISFQTAAFQGLVDVYHSCLAETVGVDEYGGDLRREYHHCAQGMVWANLRVFTEVMEALK